LSNSGDNIDIALWHIGLWWILYKTRTLSLFRSYRNSG